MVDNHLDKNAKTRVLDFLSTAPKADDNLFSFNIPAEDRLEAERYLHRMRVELARLRTYFRDRSFKPVPFTMKKVSLEQKSATVWTVTLKYILNENQLEIQSKLEHILKTLTSNSQPGKTVNVGGLHVKTR